MDEWRPIESAEESVTCLVWGIEEDEYEDAADEGREPQWGTYAATMNFQGIWFVEGGGMRALKCETHWMPLPEPPHA